MKTKILRYTDTEDGPVSFEYDHIAKGSFAKVYSKEGESKVVIVVPNDCYDKEIAAACRGYEHDNPHIPDVNLDGYLMIHGEQYKVYRMQRYHRLTTGSQAKRDYNRIKRLLKSVIGVRFCIDPIQRCVDAAEILEKQPDTDRVAMALLEIVRYATNYGKEMTFEYGLRNVMQDDAGNLVWVDMVFDTKLLAKIRSKKKERHAYSYR